MDTEEQQLEELKRWWHEHGRTIIVGVVLGLGSIIGWTTWRTHVNTQAEAVSTLYERLVDTAAAPNHKSAVTQADAIIAQHPDSGYASLSALVGAHAAFQDKDNATARRLLEWAAAHDGGFQVSGVARIRLARVLSQDGDHAAALAQLNMVTGSEYAALVAEARGDVLTAQSDADGARAAYETALAQDSLPSGARGRIELKRDTLAVQGG